MPGYHKSYQKGTGKAKKPSTYLDTALTRQQTEDRKRMQKDAKSLFFQKVPDLTPEESRIKRRYPDGLPYDDDGTYMGESENKKKQLSRQSVIQENLRLQ